PRDGARRFRRGGPLPAQRSLHRRDAGRRAEAKAANRGMWGPPCDYDAQPPPATGESKPAAPPDKPAGAVEGCDPNYSGACVPPYPPDVDCGDIRETNFRVIGADPHRLDGGKDGVACEE
ncbi:MAG: hypothetical protein M3O70_08385, partial [Actinomycetota bacterium]|nr:hypothetical protein [Actinomycetota bacterium]